MPMDGKPLTKVQSFSMWHKGVINSDSWHPELGDEIIKYLKNN